MRRFGNSIDGTPSPGANATNDRGISTGLAPKGRGAAVRLVTLPRPLGAERYAQVCCHSEHSEESLSFWLVSHLEQKKEILHFVQNDSYLHRYA